MLTLPAFRISCWCWRPCCCRRLSFANVSAIAVVPPNALMQLPRILLCLCLAFYNTCCSSALAVSGVTPGFHGCRAVSLIV
jgi:hypothetical protein